MGLLFPRGIVGRINHHIDKYLRILNGRKACKGYQVILGRTRLFFRCSRLTAHIVSRHLGRLSGTHLNGLEHGLLKEVRCGPGYGFPHQDRFLFLHHGALFIEDLLYHMGFIIGPPVEYGAECSRHLHHGAVIVLPKGIGGQIRRSHIVRRMHKPAGICLARQVYAGLVAKPENGLVFRKTLPSNHGAHTHHGHITGLHQ